MNWLATVQAALGVAMDRWLYTGPAASRCAAVNILCDFCNTVPLRRRAVIDAIGDIDAGWTVGGVICLEVELDSQGGVPVRTLRREEYSERPLPATLETPLATGSPLAQGSTSSGLASTSSSAGAEAPLSRRL
jgi:hypothetical protein